MGVNPKNSGTPKWMVKIMENPIKMDDLGVPLFLETSIWILWKKPSGKSQVARFLDSLAGKLANRLGDAGIQARQGRVRWGARCWVHRYSSSYF